MREVARPVSGISRERAESGRRIDPLGAGPAATNARPGHSEFREWIDAIGIALILALILRTFLVQAYKIPSGSMEPTLQIGDHIMVNKMIYGLRMPDSLFGLRPFDGTIPYGHYLFNLEKVHRGDVVVFVFPLDATKDFIKRVIGVAGDTVAVRNGAVFLNGKPMDDPHGHYEISPANRSPYSLRDNFGPVTVPPGHLFMMGDNRDRSYDSRFWGFVDRDEVEGRAMFIYWSWDSGDGSFLDVRWSRFGKIVR